MRSIYNAKNRKPKQRRIKNNQAFALCPLDAFITIYCIYSCRLNPKQRESMKKGDGEEERQKNKNKHTPRSLREIMRKTILNICEATSHYSPLISSLARVFIHLNYFTNYLHAGFAAFMGKLSST